MLANWVKETTTTTGTGTITLGGAATGFVAFNTVIPDQALVSYMIEDGNNRECGTGRFTSSGTTLARTIVHQTLVSGTFDNSSPTAISLSGSATVYIAPHAGMMFPLRQVPSSVSGLKIHSATETSIAGTLAVTADQIYFAPFVWNQLAQPSHVGIAVTTAQASSVCRLGLFTIDNQLDATLIHDFGTVDSSTTGDKNISIAVQIPPGPYWMGVVSDAAITVRADIYEHLRTTFNSELFGKSYGSMWKTDASAPGSGFASSYTSCTGKYDQYIPKAWLRVG